MSVAEELEETEFRETKTPFLRVATGGKGPPEGPTEPVVNWLETFQIGTVFACRANKNTVDWEMYSLMHRFTNIYLLNMETPDGKVWERRVDPIQFCKHYREYEVIAVYNLDKEAPKGDDDGNREQRNQGGPSDVVRDAPDGGDRPPSSEEER